ncbi:glutamate racemase [Vibrio genomosp. F10]|uniref:Glutamate racemase n=2 Tax=Vibrio genomosp. F10 TaxID=723171 RepID=A0A1B9R3A7_9VIBR|nr:glutamate racemase [Vibrio genomosp. F10]OCH78739.1 glutamate racemase [Vibrio genomosp. F10]OEE36235.1 glutamate racemase [Vibrio genomosp. F10 str. ZF-129]OEE94856.1 glutamate racemase [Vibrio genomosp. F10 str. 9ZC157]OEF04246.1 glutamate racemase [Vibrio genomosp. F10 str. 9ZB36]OEF08930.1 glutamate racemase [Vibrio genomosp. F10 str. 9ZD137]
MLNQNHPAVLIFDSGVGGLSVYQEIKTLLPQVNCTYLFDNEAYPYGELTQEVLIERVDTLISNFVENHHVDAVVIACNTASTIVLPALRKKLVIPVVGVVPAIKPASLLAKKAVGLIATPATITREYTKDLVRSFSSDTRVEMLGSTLLVEMAETKLRGKEVNLEALAQIIAPLIGHIDVAVLGCTHFPLIKQEIAQVLGNSVILVDSGEAIARRLKSLLNVETGNSYEGQQEVWSSAPPLDESALNTALKELGFSPVQCLRFQGV